MSTVNNKDKLEEIFRHREDFMKAIRDKKGAYGEWPIDIGQKKSQQLIKNLAYKGVEEIFEATALLKNAKEHRETEISEVDKDEFVEEVVDSFNYFLSILVLIGIDANEFYEAFMKKDKIIHDRLDSGY